MSQHHSIFGTVKLIKRDGKMVYLEKSKHTLYEDFVKSLEEGQVVETFYEACDNNGTHLQLGKIHPEIRRLALDTGCAFTEMRDIIKRNSGLKWDIDKDNVYEKSFGDCSKDELGLVIEAIESAWLVVKAVG